MKTNNFIAALRASPESKLVFVDLDGRAVHRGYHLTELKAASLQTVDCGGQTNRWQATIAQLNRLARFWTDIPLRRFLNRAMKPTLLFLLLTSTIAFAAEFDVIIKNGAVYDGSGGEAQHVDLAIKGDRIAGVGDFKNAKAK